MNTETRTCFRAVRRGFVLLAVMIFIFLLSMLGLSLLFRSQSAELAGHATAGSEQAWSAAMSGVQEAIRIASSAPAGSTDWQDNPDEFRQRPVYHDGADQWFFTVFSPASSDAAVNFRYGLTDEASRLNLNHLGGADLTKIPRLTPELAQAARAFIGAPAAAPDPAGANTAGIDVSPPASDQPADALSQTTPSDALAALTDPGADLAGSNAPFAADDAGFTGFGPLPRGALETVDELLLAPGFTWSLLHGDATGAALAEGTPEITFPSANPDARPDLGLAQYFTVVSSDPNRTVAGQPRINLNDPSAGLPAAGLPASFSNYVAALRASKQKLASVSDALEAAIQAKDANGLEVQISSGITKDELPMLLDLCSADGAPRHDGLVNVNTADAAVLATLPGMDETLAETIVSTRAGMPPERLASVAWLYQEGLVDADRFKAIAPGLTARSSQFHFQVIGYGLPSGRYRVLDVVIDLAGPAPSILYLRDITRRGMPFKLATDPLESSDTPPPGNAHG